MRSPRTTLERARAAACLDATGKLDPDVLRQYAFWCWQLRIPVVWYERRSRHSRYGRIRLDLYTTSRTLDRDAQSDLRALAPAAVVTPVDACLDRIPVRDLEAVARRAFRILTRPAMNPVAVVRKPFLTALAS